MIPTIGSCCLELFVIIGYCSLTHSGGATGGIGQGDCDDNGQYKTGLKCGKNNCHSKFGWGPAKHDCCEVDD